MTTINGNSKERILKFKKYKTQTLAIHGGQHPDPTTGAVMPPIFQTSTYAQSEPGIPIGEFEYSRSHNPTRRILEDCLALLENGTYGLACSSGMAAVTLVTSLLKTGDEILCCDDVYGGTFRLFSKILPAQGLTSRFEDFSKPESLKLSANTKIVWIETPTNPMLKIIDIEAVAKKAKAQGAIVVVDNTFASPIFQSPLDLGADIVLHSMTKYLGGHSDVVGGCLVLNSDELAEKLYFNHNSMGQILGPFDSWMMLRSLKTLPLRMKAHNSQAMELASWLEANPLVEKVIYPGLKSHPDYELAKRQMKGFGGMLSFYLKGDLQKTKKFLSKVEVFTLAESLGGVESLIEHPGIMTHASLPAEKRAALGIADNFIRISVGLEDLEDLKKDLQSALS